MLLILMQIVLCHLESGQMKNINKGNRDGEGFM